MNIKQIMTAAPGWSAVISTGRGQYTFIPLGAWALVERPGSSDTTDVIGMIAEPGHQSLEVVELGSLLGYDYPDCPTDWAAEAEEAAEPDERSTWR